MPQSLNVVKHAVLADRLTVLRDRETPHATFRQVLSEAAAIMAVEVARELSVRQVEIRTPLEVTAGVRLRDEVAVVPVLRAGLGMVEGFLRLLPEARVGHVGIYRDEDAHVPVDYYERLPPGLPSARVYVLDPMLATGGSLGGVVQFLVDRGADHITCICLLAAPEGIQYLRELTDQLGVPCTLVTASVEEGLNEHGYIVPGLGDAGDRLFGTK